MEKAVFSPTVKSEVCELTGRVLNSSIILQTADSSTTTKSTNDAIKNQKNKSEEKISCDSEIGCYDSDESDLTRLRGISYNL